MSTIYAAKVTCDAQRTAACHGLVLVEGDRIDVADRVPATLQRKGWRRGYGPRQTNDVCPACLVAMGERTAT